LLRLLFAFLASSFSLLSKFSFNLKATDFFTVPILHSAIKLQYKCNTFFFDLQNQKFHGFLTVFPVHSPLRHGIQAVTPQILKVPFKMRSMSGSPTRIISVCGFVRSLVGRSAAQRHTGQSHTHRFGSGSYAAKRTETQQAKRTRRAVCFGAWLGATAKAKPELIDLHVALSGV
jgi:hypothetical protein